MHFWRPSENKTLNNKQLQNFKHVAGRIWYFLRHVSLSLSLHLKMAFKCLFPDMGDVWQFKSIYSLLHGIYMYIRGQWCYLYDPYIIKLNTLPHFKFTVKTYTGPGVVLSNLHCRLAGSYTKLTTKKMNKRD